jgi:hypothetical protein
VLCCSSTIKPYLCICCCCCFQVDDAFNALADVLEDLLSSLRSAARVSRPKAKPPAAETLLFADNANSAVWIKLLKPVQPLAATPLQLLTDGREPVRMQQLRRPFDKNGVLHKKPHVFTCDELDVALANYRCECS